MHFSLCFPHSANEREMEDFALPGLLFRMISFSYFWSVLCNQAPLMQLKCLANYIDELSLLEYSMLCYALSLEAASSIFLAKYMLVPSKRPWVWSPEGKKNIFPFICHSLVIIPFVQLVLGRHTLLQDLTLQHYTQSSDLRNCVKDLLGLWPAPALTCLPSERSTVSIK